MRFALGEELKKHSVHGDVLWACARGGYALGEPGCWLDKAQWMSEAEAEWLARAKGQSKLRSVP